MICAPSNKAQKTEKTLKASLYPPEEHTMKTRIPGMLALPLAMALAVPALAQDSNTKSMQSQSTSNSQTPAATDANHQPLQLESKEGFWGHLNPFARKKYVRRQLSPVVGRVNELDELTASNSKAIKDVDARSSEGIRMAALKANEADTHAIEAGNRADQARQTAEQATTRLSTVEKVVGNIDQYQPVSDTEINFRAGQNILSKKAKAALDELAVPLKQQKGYVVQVQGFSAGKGQAALANSQRMAESVVRYLVINHDVPVYRIYTVGMGNAVPAKATADGSKPKRIRGGRVEISLLHNGLADFQNAQNGTAPAVSTGSSVNTGSNANSNSVVNSDRMDSTNSAQQQQLKNQDATVPANKQSVPATTTVTPDKPKQ